METKSWFASSIPAALEFARTELGENALLVSVNPAPPEARQYGRLEVTFAFEPGEQPARTRTPAPPAPRKSLTERLVLAGFSAELAADLEAASSLRAGNEDAVVVEELISRIPTKPFAEIQPGENRVLAFVGPPGRGKTMSLAKIAVTKGVSRRLAVRICSSGAQTGGANQRIARFAAILGTPFESHDSLPGLIETLERDDWHGLTLIDTPGISPSDQTELMQIRTLLSVCPRAETHLVLRSDMNAADMLYTIDRFSALAPSRLLFTGLDEAVRVTPVIETLIRSQIPATFAGTGPRVPQDIQELSGERLARAVWVDARQNPGAFSRAATA